MTDAKERNSTPAQRELPLAELHAAAGARSMAIAGWIVPAHFGDPEAEYRSARKSVALLDSSFLTVVAARGADHIEYLNRRLSQRVIEQQPGEVQRATQLNGEGRMEADLLLARLNGDQSLLLAPPTVGGAYLEMVADKFVFAEDAQFQDATDEFASLTLMGPESGAALAQVGIAAPTTRGEVVMYANGSFALINDFMAGGITIFCATKDVEALHQKLKDAVESLGGRMMGFLPFESLRVESGTPWWGIDLTDRSIPLEANLMEAIHTNKGCYPGQETIAKILNLGHPARKLVGVRWSTGDPPAPGSAITAGGVAAGTLTSSTYSPRLGAAIGLAMVRWAYREPDTDLELEDGALKGTVVPLPFPP